MRCKKYGHRVIAHPNSRFSTFREEIGPKVLGVRPRGKRTDRRKTPARFFSSTDDSENCRFHQLARYARLAPPKNPLRALPPTARERPDSGDSDSKRGAI
jgi:hypothetical protein